MLRIYNTLSRSVEEFRSIVPHFVGMYSCGPTVYDFQHIGHMRRYVGDDILIRALRFNDFNIHHVMNITDVGHLVSDNDTGEDKMDKGAKKFGLSVWEIAKKFEEQFKDSCELLNVALPKELMHATDYIPEQIDLVKRLEDKGFTYKTEDGIYFDTSKFPKYFDFSHQNPDELKAGIRVEMGEKKNVSDFALWKFSFSSGRSFDSAQDGIASQRQMEWNSPWGKGFPGWHIECSAMSMKALGNHFDIHTGGIDHINIHHTNEIAQSEAVTSEKFANYWIHHAFLTVDGQKMSKSLGNFYTVEDVVEKGFDPIALRYLYLQTHYRQEMNFTWESLEGAQNAVERLKNIIEGWEGEGEEDTKTLQLFMDSVNDDLNMPQALAVIWDLTRSDLPDNVKKATLFRMDELMGLNLASGGRQPVIPEVVQQLLKDRSIARNSKDFATSDNLRLEILKFGFDVIDTPLGQKVKSASK